MVCFIGHLRSTGAVYSFPFFLCAAPSLQQPFPATPSLPCSSFRRGLARSSVVPKLSANSGWPALFPRDSANTKAIVFFPAIHVPSFLDIVLLGQCHFIKRVLHSR